MRYWARQWGRTLIGTGRLMTQEQRVQGMKRNLRKESSMTKDWTITCLRPRNLYLRKEKIISEKWVTSALIMPIQRSKVCTRKTGRLLSRLYPSIMRCLRVKSVIRKSTHSSLSATLMTLTPYSKNSNRKRNPARHSRIEILPSRNQSPTYLPRMCPEVPRMITRRTLP